MRKQATAMIFALTAALTPTPSQALAGECRVRRAVPDINSASCTLLAATNVGFVTGATHSLPVYDPPEIPPGDDDSFDTSIGATLTGPGVDIAWEIGKAVAEPIELTEGEEYTLTLFEVGSFSVVSGAGADSADGVQARHTAQPDVVMAVDPDNPERRTTCKFGIARPDPQGAKVVFSGDLTCSNPWSGEMSATSQVQSFLYKCHRTTENLLESKLRKVAEPGTCAPCFSPDPPIQPFEPAWFIHSGDLYDTSDPEENTYGDQPGDKYTTYVEYRILLSYAVFVEHESFWPSYCTLSAGQTELICERTAWSAP